MKNACFNSHTEKRKFQRINLLNSCTLKLQTGNIKFDQLLNGGFNLGQIYEVTGQSGVGKTQLAVQLCLTSQIPKSRNGLGASVVYMSTEGRFPFKRLESMYEASKKALFLNDFDHICENIILSQRLFRGDDERLLNERSRDLYDFQKELKKLCFTFNLSVIVLNQVTSSFSKNDGVYRNQEEKFYAENSQEKFAFHSNSEEKIIPSLGFIWSHFINNRIVLSKNYLKKEENLENSKKCQPNIIELNCEDYVFREFWLSFSCNLKVELNRRSRFKVEQKGLVFY
ncbi:hypothetical protein HDU92_005555 [Lobulomyces angularis]|nr:hypothetical protein HDU92_005555 [Lobulomyces angularis]